MKSKLGLGSNDKEKEKEYVFSIKLYHERGG
jgi:hypothetical protein